MVVSVWMYDGMEYYYFITCAGIILW